MLTPPGLGSPAEPKAFDAVSLAVLDDFLASNTAFTSVAFAGAG
jgi:hypothetical protein